MNLEMKRIFRSKNEEKCYVSTSEGNIAEVEQNGKCCELNYSENLNNVDSSNNKNKEMGLMDIKASRIVMCNHLEVHKLYFEESHGNKKENVVGTVNIMYGVNTVVELLLKKESSVENHKDIMFYITNEVILSNEEVTDIENIYYVVNYCEEVNNYEISLDAIS